MRIIGSLILLMAVLSSTQTGARQSKPATDFKAHSPENTGAEKVFESAGPKVVFLIIRSSSEVHARASGIILTPDGYIATN